jgi:TetR/AcrR family transcriptional regulator
MGEGHGRIQVVNDILLGPDHRNRPVNPKKLRLPERLAVGGQENKSQREKLLASATDLFARKGFSAASIREIARTAEANSALISYHFGGKEGLYQEVLELQFSRFARTMNEAFEKDLPPREKVREMAAALLTVHRSQPHWLRLYNSEITNPTSCFETVVRKHITVVASGAARVIADGMDTGDFSTDVNPAFAALSLAAMLNYYFLVLPLVQLQEGPLTMVAHRDEEYVRQAVEVFLFGLCRRQSGES